MGAGTMSHQDLWAPWRMAYLRELSEREADLGAAPAPTGANFLVAAWRDVGNEKDHHVVLRNAHGLLMLNRYPYSNGHLLVALGDPRPTLLEYSHSQREELWHLVDMGVEMVQRAFHPQGVNIGVNQGRAAGAGVPEHLHVHIVPRWNGDTNFMATIGDVRVLPDSLDRAWSALRAVAP